jgi:hypothetical protein
MYIQWQRGSQNLLKCYEDEKLSKLQGDGMCNTLYLPATLVSNLCIQPSSDPKLAPGTVPLASSSASQSLKLLRISRGILYPPPATNGRCFPLLLTLCTSLAWDDVPSWTEASGLYMNINWNFLLPRRVLPSWASPSRKESGTLQQKVPNRC